MLWKNWCGRSVFWDSHVVKLSTLDVSYTYTILYFKCVFFDGYELNDKHKHSER